MTTTVSTIKKTVLKRSWKDVEPKVYAALSSGGAAALVLLTLHFAGVQLSSVELVGIPYLASIVAMYVKASTHKGGLLEELETDGPAQLQQLATLAAAAGVPGVGVVKDDIERVVELLQEADPVAAVTELIAAEPTVTLPVVSAPVTTGVVPVTPAG